MILYRKPIGLACGWPRHDKQYGRVALHPVVEILRSADVLERILRFVLPLSGSCLDLHAEHNAEALTRLWVAQLDSSVNTDINRASWIPNATHLKRNSLDQIDAQLPKGHLSREPLPIWGVTSHLATAWTMRGGL